MNKPNERTQKAINTIKHGEDFTVFLKWLQESQRENDINLRIVSAEKLGHYQGISHALDVITTAIGPR